MKVEITLIREIEGKQNYQGVKRTYESGGFYCLEDEKDTIKIPISLIKKVVEYAKEKRHTPDKRPPRDNELAYITTG